MDNVIESVGNLLIKLQSPDFYEREEAVKQLGTFQVDEAVAGLVIAIEDPDLGIRELAADYLSRIKGNTASQLLIRFLGNEDIGSRNLASEILVKIGVDAVPALIENLNSDDHDIRKFIADILGLIRDVRAVAPLCEKLWDENNNVVCSAAEALGEIGSPEAIPHLLAAVEKIEDARLQAVEALGKIGDPSVLEKLYGFLDSSDPMLLYAVIEAIGDMGAPDAIKRLLPFLGNDDRLIAEVAMMAVIKISRKTNDRIDIDLPLNNFTGFLFDGIKNRNFDITEFTLSRLSHWYGREVIKGLLDVLDFVDENNLVRITDILSEAGHQTGKLIVQKLGNASSGTKVRLLEVVQQFIDEDLAVEILVLADDPDQEVRQKAAQVLGVSGFMGAIPVLKKLAGDPIGHVRAAAYSALGWLCTAGLID